MKNKVRLMSPGTTRPCGIGSELWLVLAPGVDLVRAWAAYDPDYPESLGFEVFDVATEARDFARWLSDYHSTDVVEI